MATTTYLSSPNLTINSVVLQDQCHGLTFTRTIEALESTAFGSGSRVYTAGLENSTMSCDLYLSFEATETYATLKALVGTSTTVSWSASATSPGTATKCWVGAYPLIPQPTQAKSENPLSKACGKGKRHWKWISK